MNTVIRTCSIRALLSVVLLTLSISPTVRAQGSIFGAVQNADLSVPPDSALVFVGYLNDTDNEIRLKISDGAGYDNGNWFDDFQNYLDEAPGIPYTYLFFDIVRQEFFELARTVPSNSFQQENVLLSPATLVPRPDFVNTRRIADTVVQVMWPEVSGTTYHLYRREASSGGSFFRIDDPDGQNLTGITDTVYFDSTVQPAMDYTYLVIAIDGAGNFSPPSDTSASECCIGVRGNVNGDPLEDVDIADATFLVNHLFVTFQALPCRTEANINADTGGAVDIADLTRLVNHLFITFEPLLPCPS